MSKDIFTVVGEAYYWAEGDVLTFEPVKGKAPAQPRQRPEHRERNKSRAGVQRHA